MAEVECSVGGERGGSLDGSPVGIMSAVGTTVEVGDGGGGRSGI